MSSTAAPQGTNATDVMRRASRNVDNSNGDTRRESRDVMDECVREVKRGGRASLIAIEDEMAASMKFEETQSARLLDIIAKLSFANTKVAQDDDKYIVLRDGITSFVYMADDKATSPSRQRVN